MTLISIKSTYIFIALPAPAVRPGIASPSKEWSAALKIRYLRTRQARPMWIS